MSLKIIDIQTIIDRVTAETGYSCDWSREEMPILQAKTDLPFIYIGLLEEKPFSPQSVFSESHVGAYQDTFGQLDTIIFSVQILSTVQQIYEHKEKVKQALSGWSPVPVASPSEFSSLSSGRGMVQAVNNGRVLWFQEYITTVPSV